MVIRTLEYKEYGFHKPVMLAGGIGSIKEDQIKKGEPQPGDLLLFLVGRHADRFRGGSASSTKKTNSNSDLDYASAKI